MACTLMQSPAYDQNCHRMPGMISDFLEPAVRPLLIVTTGGTIDKVYFDAKSDYEVGDSVVDQLLQQAHVRAPFVRLSPLRKDSLELTDEDRQLIRQTIEERTETQVVVTHGTDTMTDTAAVLSTLPDRVIVMTGALAPARFAESDATFNVGMAFAAAQTLSAGVYIAMNGEIFRWDQVRKDRAQNAFVRC
jgi:L-asparaginase